MNLCRDAFPLARRSSVVKVLFRRIESGPAPQHLSPWSQRDDRLRSTIERTAIEWQAEV